MSTFDLYNYFTSILPRNYSTWWLYKNDVQKCWFLSWLEILLSLLIIPIT